MNKDEFYQKLEEANKIAIQKYKREDPEYKKKLQDNEAYIGAYLNLVLSAFRNYNYRDNCFAEKNISKECYESLGVTNSFSTDICTITEDGKDCTKVVMTVIYLSDGKGHISGRPGWADKMDEKFVREVLAEDYGIKITQHTAAWDDEKEIFEISFDAKPILDTKRKIIEMEAEANLEPTHQK